LQIWRVECLATPAWRDACARCGGVTDHDSTGLFRVNSNGVRHDLWLLYRCRGCGDTRKRRLAQRRLARELPGGSLAPYLANDAAWARRHAFALAPPEPLPYRVWRPGPPVDGVLRVRIASPEPCGERWDRFLARELACSRGEVARAARSGALRLEGASALARPVQDGQGFEWARCGAPRPPSAAAPQAP
jgi:hypothetical protein